MKSQCQAGLSREKMRAQGIAGPDGRLRLREDVAHPRPPCALGPGTLGWPYPSPPSFLPTVLHPNGGGAHLTPICSFWPSTLI